MFLFNAIDKDFLHLYLSVLIDVNVNKHAVIARHIFALHNVYLAILKALFLEVLFDVMFCAVHHVGRNLVTWLETNNLFAVLAFRLFHTIIVNT